jgi:hypothetical protein
MGPFWGLDDSTRQRSTKFDNDCHHTQRSLHSNGDRCGTLRVIGGPRAGAPSGHTTGAFLGANLLTAECSLPPTAWGVWGRLASGLLETIVPQERQVREFSQQAGWHLVDEAKQLLNRPQGITSRVYG